MRQHGWSLTWFLSHDATASIITPLWTAFTHPPSPSSLPADAVIHLTWRSSHHPCLLAFDQFQILIPWLSSLKAKRKISKLGEQSTVCSIFCLHPISHLGAFSQANPGLRVNQDVHLAWWKCFIEVYFRAKLKVKVKTGGRNLLEKSSLASDLTESKFIITLGYLSDNLALTACWQAYLQGSQDTSQHFRILFTKVFIQHYAQVTHQLFLLTIAEFHQCFLYQ